MEKTFVQALDETVQRIDSVLSHPILHPGGTTLTLGRILYLTLLVIVLLYGTRLFKRWLLRRVLSRSQMDLGARQATTTLTGYAILLLGFMIILQTSGIDLTTLNVIAGAVGVGVGLGLQEVANNFISGLIILFERPIKVGDRVQVGEVNGGVVAIRARSTTIVTNDNIAIIVPNSKFITENVINWTGTDPKIRFGVPVGVAYGSDPRVVEKALLEAARENDDVLPSPPAGVWFVEFGDSSLNFELRAWTATQLQNKGQFISALNFAIHDKLAKYGIPVPFPQRDLHLKDGRLEVRVVNEGES